MLPRLTLLWALWSPATYTVTLTATVAPPSPHEAAVWDGEVWRLHGAFVGETGPAIIGDLVWGADSLTLERQ